MAEVSHDDLQRLVGEWTMDAPIHGVSGARVTFEWMPGERFLLGTSDAPDPIPRSHMVMGPTDHSDGCRQHYFDSRGVARIYQMSLADGVWKLWREEADFSPLDFEQRFTGTFREDGNTIEATLEINHDGTWEKDFDLTYRRVT